MDAFKINKSKIEALNTRYKEKAKELTALAKKRDAYLEQTIVRDDENSFVIGTGETFYKATVDTMKVFSVENILRDDLH